MGHLTLVSKRLSEVGSKRISQFFDSAVEPRSRSLLLSIPPVFVVVVVVVVLYSSIVEYALV